LLVFVVPPFAFASSPPPDRSFLWRSEEALGHVIPPEMLADWPRDAVYGYDVEHVHLVLALDMVGEGIDGSGTLTVTITEAGLAELPVDLDDALTVSAAFVDGLPATFTQTPDQVLVALASPPEPGAELDVRVDYAGTPQLVGNKSMRWGDHAGVPEVYVLSTPFSNSGATVIPISHYWRPCKDVPDDKSTFSCELTVPDDMLACSNGVMTSDVDNGDGTRTLTWEHGYPVAPFLITLGATNYLTLEDVYHGAGGDVAIQHFVYPERYAAAQTSFDITVPALEFMATVFGEYPFLGEKYGVFSTGGGPAVEEQTMVAYPYTLITGTHEYDWLFVHEMSHQWWGDCVTAQNWAEVWLHEGFASYAEALWWEHRFGINAYRSYMVSMDDGPYDGTIYDPPYIWNAIVYEKGAWILHMLRHVMGDDDFFQLLLDFRAAHEHGNVVTGDLVAAAEAIYGSDLGWFFEPWIYHEGRPYYQFAWTSNDSWPYTVHLTILQLQSQAYPTYTMPIDVEVTTLAGVENHVVWDSLRVQTFDIPVEDEPSIVRLDRWRWILADFDDAPTSAPAGAAAGAFLAQNSPNPFNPSTRIRFGVTQPGRVSLRVFDLRGRMLRSLLSERVDAGEHAVDWDGRDDRGRPLPSGTYFCRLVGPDGVQERKMTLVH